MYQTHPTLSSPQAGPSLPRSALAPVPAPGWGGPVESAGTGTCLGAGLSAGMPAAPRLAVLRRPCPATAQPPATPSKPKPDFPASFGCSLPRTVTSSLRRAPAPLDHGRTPPPRVHPAVPQGFTELSSQRQRGTRGRREPGSPFPLRSGSRAGAARVKAPPCAVRPRLICEPPPGAGEGGQPRAGEPDASQRREENRRGGCSSFPMSILPQPDRHSAQTSPCPQKVDPQPKSGDWGFCPHKEGGSEGTGLSSGLRAWPRVIYYRDN